MFSYAVQYLCFYISYLPITSDFCITNVYDIIFFQMTTDTVPGVAQFQHGDLVFAKVKGYPFWPARIDCVRLEKCRKKRQKNKPEDQNSYWPIFFYGTHETLWINESDLRPFEENRSSLGHVQNTSSFLF